MGQRGKSSKNPCFRGKRHDNKILKVQILLSRSFVVIAQAPNCPQQSPEEVLEIRARVVLTGQGVPSLTSRVAMEEAVNSTKRAPTILQCYNGTFYGELPVCHEVNPVLELDVYAVRYEEGCLLCFQPTLRYFRKPLRGPRPTESENPPATQKEKFQKTPKTPIIPKSKHSFPKK